MCLSHSQIKAVVMRRCKLDAVTASAVASMLREDRKLSTRRGFDSAEELQDHLDFVEDLETEGGDEYLF